MAQRAISKEERVREIVKCGKDAVYFIKNYVKIQHPVRGRIPFDTYDFQEDVVNDIQDHRFNIVLKSRQLGLSTIAAAYAVWYAIFHKDKNILVIATKLATAMNFIKKVKVALTSVPSWLLMPQFEASKTAVNFTNGSQIIAVPTSEDAGRSEALSLLIVDEAAFIRNFEDIWTGLYPTISTGGRALILSTPNGVGGMYYKLWTDAVAGQNEFNTIDLPWHVHPEHDQAWFDKETRNLPARKVAQEFLCDFIASGDTFLEPEQLKYLRDLVQEPIERAGHDKNVWIWEKPVPGHQYVISADIARGDSADYSTFHIIDYETCCVVAEYMGKTPPEKMAVMLNAFGRQYNDALCVPEQNTYGYLTVTLMRDQLTYPKLWNKFHKGDPMLCYTNTSQDVLPGFSTQGNTRPQILAKLDELIRNEQLTIRSKRTLDQFQSFIWHNGKPQAMRDAHDDLIMSLAIGSWFVEGASTVTNGQREQAMAMLRATGKSGRTEEKQGLHAIQAVQPLVDPNIRGMNPRTVHRPRDPSQVRHADVSDFSWVL